MILFNSITKTFQKGLWNVLVIGNSLHLLEVINTIARLVYH